ncbi:DUF3311 domain-containing protein [Flexivirga caeni]|uniref:DUF3311 domain-containing protein n=1 Tax=Flexivirga caeni TaxID=2294115 RepID=A0A3M9M7G9_9MICO|nr:DUF3311 domain-containing protein [Flexivirga caeni]RNI21167.1 DUF3311 domain-containing protein [Flexivirga caeni]
MTQHRQPDMAPPADRRLLVIAGIVLAIPMLALVPVGWYSKYSPRLNGFTFFIWYQMALVVLCAICTSIAYVLVKKARPHVPFQPANDSKEGA